MSITSRKSSDSPSTKQSILSEATAAVFGERQQKYGHPRDNMQRTADLLNGYFAAKGVEFRASADDIPVMMILLKLARLVETPGHRDSIVDVAGYAEVLARTTGLDD